jgi:hypothetical protein
MSHLLLILGLTVLHFITGYGLLRLFNVKLKPLPFGALAIIAGIAVASFLPFILQLFYISITKGSVYTLWAITILLLNVKTLLTLKHFSIKKAFTPVPKIRIYEIPALLVLGFLLFVSIWRCSYYPSYVRDALSGPEAIAEYTIKEHTMINSIFSVNLESTNNQFKSPYLTDLQIIYKMAGFPFGAVWLSILVVSLFVFLYYALCEKLHPVLSGILLLVFIATPEAYGYTFMYLYDYSNMIFFFLGFYYLFSYFKSRSQTEFYFAALLFAISVYIRSETLVLVGMVFPAVIFSAYKAKESYVKVIMHFAALLLIGVLAYWLPTELYNNHYLPQTYKIDSLFNKDITNLEPLWKRFSEMNDSLIFGERGQMLWGYFMYIFVILLGAELVIKRRLTREARNWLYAVLVVYLGLPLLGFVFPLMDLDNSTKRGLFKILPLMLLYMGNNQLLIGFSEKMRKMEYPEASGGKKLAYDTVVKDAGHSKKNKENRKVR